MGYFHFKWLFMIPASNKASIATGKFYAALSRPQNAVFSGMLCIFMYVLAGGAFLSLTAAALYLLIAQLYTFAVTINNIYDAQLDKANKRTSNPLALMTAQQRHLSVFLCIVAIIILCLQWFMVQPQTLLLVITYLGLSVAYSMPPFHLKKHGLFGIAALSACYVAIPMAIGWAQMATVNTHQVIIIVGTSVLACAGLLAKDYKDIKGDSQYGLHTPLIRYGKGRVILLAYVFTGAGSLLLYASSSWVVLLATAAYALAVWQIHQRNGTGLLWYRAGHAALLLTAGFMIW